jgi:replicative DNA helicase
MGNRRLPASVEVERSILGAILLDNLAYSQAAAQLHPEDFSLDAHRRIYSCMMDLAVSSHVGYVSGLLDGVPDRPSIEHYVRIVKEKALLRALLHAADNTISRARGGDESGEQLLAASEGELRTIAERYSYATESTRIHTWEQIPTLDQLPIADVSWLVEGMVPVGSIALWAGESWFLQNLAFALPGQSCA